MISNICDNLIKISEEESLNQNLFNKFSLESIKLKRLNRNQLLSLDSRRCEVEKTKERVGQAQLTLENLLYKQSYLLREIQICKNFVASELKETEKEIQTSLTITEYCPDLKEKHRSSLEFLENELKLRQQLEQEILTQQTLLNERNEILTKKRKTLEEFPEKLKSLKTLASELSETYLENDSSSINDININLSTDLPTPLFVLFRTFHSFISQNVLNVKIVLVEEKNQKNVGELAIELTIYQSSLSTSSSSSSFTSSSTFLFQYHQRCNVILVKVKNISTPSQDYSFPFQSLDICKCLLPPQFRNFVSLSEDIDTKSGNPEIWAQWIAGLRPLPSQEFEFSVLTAPSFINLIQTRLQSLQRLSQVLHLLEQNRNAMNTISLPLILEEFINKITDKRVEVLIKSINKVILENDPFIIPSISISTSINDNSETSNSNILNLESFDMKERLIELDLFNDKEECIYYRLQLLLTYYGEEQLLNVILAIPSNYPLKTPQFLLSSRKSSNSSSGFNQSYNATTTLKAIEQEINAGCLLYFENMKSEVISNNYTLEELLDSILSFQIRVLYSLLSSGATFGVVSNSSLGSLVGKNRRSNLLTQLYGKRFVGI